MLGKALHLLEILIQVYEKKIRETQIEQVKKFCQELENRLKEEKHRDKNKPA